MKKQTLATSLLVSAVAATTLFSAPAEDAAAQQRMQEISDSALASSVLVSIKPKLDGVEEPLLAVERERCPNCGNFHSTGYSTYIESERSIFLVGYVLSDDTVLCRDLLLNLENIDSIQISKGSAVVGATMHKVFKDQKAVVLKLDAPLAGVKPATIAQDAGKPEASVIVDSIQVGLSKELIAMASPSLGNPSRHEKGTTHYSFENDAVLFDDANKFCGFNFNATITGNESFNPAQWESLTMEALLATTQKIVEASGKSTVPVKLDFRSIKRKRSSSRNRWSSREDDDKITELKTVGTLISGTRLIIHVDEARNEIPRLEKIRVFFPDGTEEEADFAFALKTVNAFVADLRKPHPENALKIATEPFSAYADKLLMLVQTAPAGEGKTKIRTNRIRIQSLESGWRNLPTVDLPLSESAGDAIFNENGEAYWMTVSVMKTRETLGDGDRWSYNNQTLFMEASVFASLATPEAKDIDTALKPVSVESDGATGWVGLDLQKLDDELAEAMNVVTETEKGDYGAIVVSVHSGSSADQAGVKKGWILLSVTPPGNNNPMKVQVSDPASAYSGRFPWDRLGEIPAQYFDNIPSPWPAVKNDFTVALLRMGIGSKIQANFIADGQKITKDLTIETSPKYYENAPTFKWAAAGISVCDLTFEVREYLNLAADAPGVVVCKMETSGKAVISGIKQFELITLVNGTPVKSVKEFEDIVKNTKEFKLDVLRMTNTRVVQFTLNGDAEPATEKAEDDAEEIRE